MPTLNAQKITVPYSILCTRLFTEPVRPADIDELPLLYCSSCGAAYLVISDDPDLLPSLAEWNSRIVSLSDAIMLEHECGHPSTHFVHDGTLTPYRRKKGLFSGWNAKASTVTKV